MKVGLGLGSNVADRLLNLQHAKRYLLSLSIDQGHLQSPVYETEPVGCPVGSGKFLNAVLEIEFSGTPSMLLEKLQVYEKKHGRDRSGGVNAPRTIDLDILYFGDQELMTSKLVIPHPRMAERRFVLLPLSTIRPDMIVKGTGKTVRELLRELPGRAGDVKLVQKEW